MNKQENSEIVTSNNIRSLSDVEIDAVAGGSGSAEIPILQVIINTVLEVIAFNSCAPCQTGTTPPS